MIDEARKAQNEFKSASDAAEDRSLEHIVHPAWKMYHAIDRLAGEVVRLRAVVRKVRVETRPERYVQAMTAMNCSWASLPTVPEWDAADDAETRRMCGEE